ncbi:unnamed protein product [Caenorhabditis angaria]|uniref:F-box domain-containing protein n=1 Tax=Caenorhabditis angaria TaxID=860376 RepID=A0A9P1J3U2_9PELO|nr:unnamed protein product [Caenorhabditis angaria]
MVATRRKKAETKKHWRLACKASRFIAILNKPKMKHFEEIPIEVRSVIVDKMRPEDRCRFARCSRLCENLAKTSIFYMYGLAFSSSTPNKYTITVQHHRYDRNPGSRNQKDYKIKFEKQGRKKQMRIKTPAKTLVYPLAKNTNLLEAAVEKFEKLVNDNARCLRYLEVSCAELDERQFNFNEISRLETLSMRYLNLDLVRRFHYPLKTLHLGESFHDVTIESLGLMPYIFLTQDMLSGCFDFTLHQLIQLTADKIRVSIGGWNARTCYDLIYHWKRAIDPRKRWYSLGIQHNPQRIIRGLISMLNLHIDDVSRARIRIYAGSFNGKSAKLQFLGDGIFFAYPFEAYDLSDNDEEDFPHVDYTCII